MEAIIEAITKTTIEALIEVLIEAIAETAIKAIVEAIRPISFPSSPSAYTGSKYR